MKNEKQWYIVYTHAGNELKTLIMLKKKHVECFCPMQTTTAAKHKNVAIPLLPNYIFVHITPCECATIRQIQGVVNVMYWLGDPVVVSDEDIFILKELTERYRCLTVEKIRVDTSLGATHVWESVPVKNNTDFDAGQDFLRVSFPAYGFAITAMQREVNVRVVNVVANRNLQRTESLEYSK